MNKVLLSGQMGDVSFSHEFKDISFYSSKLKVKRDSGVIDTIPIIFQEKHLHIFKKYDFIYLEGLIKTYRNKVTGVQLVVYAYDAKTLDKEEYLNVISLSGKIEKAPIFRVTPQKRSITDLSIMISEIQGFKVFVPCIAWGENARKAEGFQIGESILLKGRLQSRDFSKQMPNGNIVAKTIVEVSISDFLNN